MEDLSFEQSGMLHARLPLARTTTSWRRMTCWNARPARARFLAALARKARDRRQQHKARLRATIGEQTILEGVAVGEAIPGVITTVWPASATTPCATGRILSSWMGRAHRTKETARRRRQPGCWEYVRKHHLHVASSARPAPLAGKGTAPKSAADARVVQPVAGRFSCAFERHSSVTVPHGACRHVLATQGPASDICKRRRRFTRGLTMCWPWVFWRRRWLRQKFWNVDRHLPQPHFHMHSHCTLPTTCAPWPKGPEGSRRIVCPKKITYPRVMCRLAPHSTLNTSTSSLSFPLLCHSRPFLRTQACSPRIHSSTVKIHWRMVLLQNSTLPHETHPPEPQMRGWDLRDSTRLENSSRGPSCPGGHSTTRIHAFCSSLASGLWGQGKHKRASTCAWTTPVRPLLLKHGHMDPHWERPDFVEKDEAAGAAEAGAAPKRVPAFTFYAVVKNCRAAPLSWRYRRLWLRSGEVGHFDLSPPDWLLELLF